MPLFDHVIRLSKETLRVWVRNFATLFTILGLGWVLYSTALIASSTLGTTWDPLPTIVFALAVCAQVVAVILAIASLKSDMTAVDSFQEQHPGPVDETIVPREVFRREKPVEIAIAVIGPILAVYALWSVLDGMVADGMLWNIMLQGFGNPTWSVSFAPDRWSTYFAVGVAALLLRIVWGRLTRGRSSWWRSPLVLFEGIWTAMSFFILAGLISQGQAWLLGRSISVQLQRWWLEILHGLPEIQLPIGITLPELIRDSVTWFTSTLLPGIWIGLVLPLMWLSVTAMVFGWRSFDVAGLLHPSLRERTGTRLGNSLSWRMVSRLGFLFDDIKYKYLPLIHCWRLVWRAGAHLLGAFLVVAAILHGVSHLVQVAVLQITSRLDPTASLLVVSFFDEVVFTSIHVALYAVTFDKAARIVLGLVPADSTRSVYVPTP